MIFTAEHSLQDLAKWLLSRVGLAHEPPVILGPLVEGLGVGEIRRTEDGPTGRVVVREERIVIELRRDVPRQMFRFTLAHELGHVVLADASISLAAMRREWRLEDDERFCDELAGALLFPSWWLRQRYVGVDQNLNSLRECSSATRTSLRAALVALNRHAGWSRALLHWRLDEDGLSLWGTTMVPHGLRHRIRGTSATVRLVREIDGAEQVMLPLLVAGRAIVVPAQVDVRGSSCMALLDRQVLHAQAVLPARRRSKAGGISTREQVSSQIASGHSRDLPAYLAGGQARPEGRRRVS